MRTNEQIESVLVVRRKDNGMLACVGGFVEVGETLQEATRREVKEETGLDVTSLQMLPRVRRSIVVGGTTFPGVGLYRYFHVFSTLSFDLWAELHSAY